MIARFTKKDESTIMNIKKFLFERVVLIDLMMLGFSVTGLQYLFSFTTNIGIAIRTRAIDEIILIDKCGHGPQTERPEEFYAAMTSFIETYKNN